MASNDWLRYANQDATRNLPISRQLEEALAFLPELGVSMEVFSGGQPAAGQGPRVGSVRHDHGNAADVFFYQDGRQLNWANPEDRPIFEQIVSRGRQAGITGFGAGPGYMRPGSMHIGFGSPGVWGAGGRGANAPEWLRAAYYAAPAPAQPTAPAVMAINAAAPPPQAPAAPGIGFATQPRTAGLRPQQSMGIGGLVPSFSPEPLSRRSVAVQTVGQGGGARGYLEDRAGARHDPRRAIRQANSDAIRAATGSGAITRQSIQEALSKGAKLYRRQ